MCYAMGGFQQDGGRGDPRKQQESKPEYEEEAYAETSGVWTKPEDAWSKSYMVTVKTGDQTTQILPNMP